MRHPYPITPTEMLHAYGMGIDDGLLLGTQAALQEGHIREDAKDAYIRGYDHGVALYCEINHKGE